MSLSVPLNVNSQYGRIFTEQTKPTMLLIWTLMIFSWMQGVEGQLKQSELMIDIEEKLSQF